MNTTPILTHAAYRLHERYGIILTTDLHATLLRKARTGTRTSLLARVRNPRRFVWKIRHGKRTFCLVTDHRITEIITFLPVHDPFGHESEHHD